MRLRWGLESFLVGVMSLICLTGCSEKEEGPQAEEPAASKSDLPASDPAVAPAAASVSMEAFLERRVRMRPAAAGHEIGAFFASWEQMLKHRSREPVDIHFEVEVEGAFGQDHAWTSSTNRGILDELAREYDLAWTVTEPNTIRITSESE